MVNIFKHIIRLEMREVSCLQFLLHALFGYSNIFRTISIYLKIFGGFVFGKFAHNCLKQVIYTCLVIKIRRVRFTISLLALFEHWCHT